MNLHLLLREESSEKLLRGPVEDGVERPQMLRVLHGVQDCSHKTRSAKTVPIVVDDDPHALAVGRRDRSNRREDGFPQAFVALK